MPRDITNPHESARIFTNEVDAIREESDGDMNARLKSLISSGVAMSAGGFTSSQLTLSPVAKAAVVGMVAIAVMALMLIILPESRHR